MRTFSIQTLGCKVNQYESEQIAALLRSRGLVESDVASADLRVVNTCSVTIEAASKSRSTARRATRLPVLQTEMAAACSNSGSNADWTPTASNSNGTRARVIVTGCWATSDKEAAANVPGVDAVIGHHDEVAKEIGRALDAWDAPSSTAVPGYSPSPGTPGEGWGEGDFERHKAVAIPNHPHPTVPELQEDRAKGPEGTRSLPLLGQRQSGHQRAFLKIQDGCDAHCTYCIIPSLRPAVWSKPVADCVEEARRLVDAGHVELILTGIFLGAYGQATALRRRQASEPKDSVATLIDALCGVPGLKRLRLSSLEPGDLTADLIAVLRSHRQVVPHFHLPLQSGSDRLLRRMNRQYTRDDFLDMLDRVGGAFDRPALTTDIIVGFPGETDEEFAQTEDIVHRAGFIHVHAFPFSPRPGTAAARWTGDFIHGDVVNERIKRLGEIAEVQSGIYRETFVGQTVELLVERPSEKMDLPSLASVHHGRCERYFDVSFEYPDCKPGDFVRARIDRVSSRRTHGTFVEHIGRSDR